MGSKEDVIEKPPSGSNVIRLREMTAKENDVLSPKRDSEGSGYAGLERQGVLRGDFPLSHINAVGGTRTPTGFLPIGPKPIVSTNSTTAAESFTI